MSILIKDVPSLPPRQKCHSGTLPVTAASLAAAVQETRGGPFESHILLCMTSHSFPLGNHNFFTHLIVFLTGNQLCLSLWLGRNLVFQATGLNPGDKIFMRPWTGNLYLAAQFSSPFASSPGQRAAVTGKIMAAALPPAYYTLSASDLRGRPPSTWCGVSLAFRPLSHPDPTVRCSRLRTWEQTTPRYQTVNFPPPLRIPCADEEKKYFWCKFYKTES